MVIFMERFQEKVDATFPVRKRDQQDSHVDSARQSPKKDPPPKRGVEGQQALGGVRPKRITPILVQTSVPGEVRA
jgi:hypothetical protein